MLTMENNNEEKQQLEVGIVLHGFIGICFYPNCGYFGRVGLNCRVYSLSGHVHHSLPAVCLSRLSDGCGEIMSTFRLTNACTW